MRNLTMMTDLYELTMMYGYYAQGKLEEKAVFDLFYRQNPCDNGFAIAAGLEQAIDFLANLRFDNEDLEYLRSLALFDEGFLEYLRDFKFTCDVYAVPEGTVIFPKEPLMQIVGPIGQAQLVETCLLNIINHQTLIATKACRVVKAAEGDPVLEFGLRRAQAPDAGIYGARASMIGGCKATSNVLAGQMFDVPVKGTHAHSWVQSFPSELEAFRAYAEAFPDSCLLLVDTYDTLRSGVPNAIQVGKELREKGYELVGIRLDSGDLAYLSKKARRMLDEAGFPNAMISASSDLDEYLIRDLKAQGAKITLWGVGTNLITSRECPSLGGVYKLVAKEEKGEFIAKIKISENPVKITNPGFKKVIRLYDAETKKAMADVIMLAHEHIDISKPLTIFHPEQTWKRKTLTNFVAKNLLVPVFIGGIKMYTSPSVREIQSYCEEDLNTFWDEYTRLRNPQEYFVDLSQELYDLKQQLLKEKSNSF